MHNAIKIFLQRLGRGHRRQPNLLDRRQAQDDNPSVLERFGGRKGRGFGPGFTR